MGTKGTYTAIQDWMLDLGLDVWETIAYAVIFGFSQDGESTFTGSLAYLSRKMMCSRAKTINALKRLVEIGLIQKIAIVRNGVRFCEYRAYLPETGGISEIPGGGIPERPNNIEYENIEIRDKSNTRFTPPTFEQVRDYCASRGNTIDPQSFIDYYTANGWRVGRNPMRDWQAAIRQWEQRRREDNSGPRRPAPRQQQPVSVWDAAARAADNITRRLMSQPYDEQ